MGFPVTLLVLAMPVAGDGKTTFCNELLSTDVWVDPPARVYECEFLGKALGHGALVRMSRAVKAVQSAIACAGNLSEDTSE